MTEAPTYMANPTYSLPGGNALGDISTDVSVQFRCKTVRSDPRTELSRALSKTLRHAAKSQGIPQDNEGWCFIEDLLSRNPYKSRGTTYEGILEVIANDQKKRYELSEDGQKIRACQGHSVKFDVGLVELNEAPNVLIHGTSQEAWNNIRSQGLSRMKRLHIHLASGLPGENGVISGMRPSSPVRIYIDGAKLLSAGISLYKASNGAILCPGDGSGLIGPEYFSHVEIRKDNEWVREK